jgi:hypothetical protein
MFLGQNISSRSGRPEIIVMMQIQRVMPTFDVLELLDWFQHLRIWLHTILIGCLLWWNRSVTDNFSQYLPPPIFAFYSYPKILESPIERRLWNFVAESYCMLVYFISSQHLLKTLKVLRMFFLRYSSTFLLFSCFARQCHLDRECQTQFYNFCMHARLFGQIPNNWPSSFSFWLMFTTRGSLVAAIKLPLADCDVFPSTLIWLHSYKTT